MLRLASIGLIVLFSSMHSILVTAQARDAASPSEEVAAQVEDLRASSQVRDSLSALADSATGATREFLEESIAQRRQEVHAGVLSIVERIQDEQQGGADVAASRSLLDGWLREEWPRYRTQLQRRMQTIVVLSRSSDGVTGSERVELEGEISGRVDRLLQAYESLVDEVVALERIGVDVAGPRQFLVQGLPSAAAAQLTRVQLAGRARANALARLSQDADNAELRYALEAADERLKRSSQVLWTGILLMDRLGLDTQALRVGYIGATGKLTADIFKWRVLLGVLRAQGLQLLDLLASKAPQWIFQAALITVTFLAFRTLARLARRVVRRAVGYARFSGLLRGTIVGLAGTLVMLIGVVVILTQLGVQVGPLLAGFGVAGVVIGFAMQNTLSNFAAGGMILGNRTFDLGDDIEVAGVTGVVKHMNLMSTTILTGDNQTIIIPNSTVMSGVIRNQTTQPNRRVDLVFGIGYADDIDQAERVLEEIVASQPQVLKEPVAVIRLHQLADSSVNFVVRVWTQKQHYWEVYWGITRAVKLRFDQEGISIPAPQREVHLKAGRGTSAPTVAVRTTGSVES